MSSVSSSGESIASLLSQLSSTSGADKAVAGRTLGNLVLDGHFNNSPSLRESAVASLIPHLRNEEDEVKEAAAAALGDLAEHNDVRRVMLKNGAIPLLVSLLRSSSDTVQQEAAHVLGVLAEDGSCVKQIALDGAMPALGSMLESGSDGAKEEASKALLTLAGHTGNDSQGALFHECVITPLVQLLGITSPGVQEQATRVLLHLASCHFQNKYLILEAGAAMPLLTLLRCDSDTIKEQAIQLIKLIAVDGGGGGVLRVIEDVSAIPTLVHLLGTTSETMRGSVVNILECAWKQTRWKSNLRRDIAAELENLLSCGTETAKEGALDLIKVCVMDNEEGKKIIGEFLIPDLVALLPSGSDSMKESALQVLAHLALLKELKDDIFPLAVGQSEGPLVLLLQCSSDAVKALAVCVLKNLVQPPPPASGSKHAYVCTHVAPAHLVLALVSATPTLVSLLRWSSDAVRLQVAGLLGVMARQRGTGRCIREEGAIAALVSLLGSSSKMAEAASSALVQVTDDEDNGRWVVAAGAIPLLIGLRRSNSSILRGNAVAVMKNLAKDGSMWEQSPFLGFIPALVSLLSCTSESTAEAATSALVDMTSDQDEAKQVVAAGAIPLLESLSKRDSSILRSNAAAVLNNLHAACPSAKRQRTSSPS